jgi:hypothetical protein
MDHSFSCIENLDREIWTRCPVAENKRRVDEAEAEVNRLLERRLVVQLASAA